MKKNKEINEPPLRKGYFRVRFKDGTYKDYLEKGTENYNLITAEQVEALGIYAGSPKMKKFSEMTEEEQKLFSEDKWNEFREEKDLGEEEEL